MDVAYHKAHTLKKEKKGAEGGSKKGGLKRGDVESLVCAHMARPRSVHGPRSSSFCCGQGGGEGEGKEKYVIIHKQASNAKKEGGKRAWDPKRE